jgi:cell shape-determining protein MreC
MAIGDTICTSGLSAIYPSDIPLGRAVSIRSVNGISKTINVELFQDFKMLQYVYVVVDRDADKIRDIQRVYEE